MGYKEGPPRFHIRPPLLKKISSTFHIYRRFLIFLTFFIITVLTLVINYSNNRFASQARVLVYEMTEPIAIIAHVPYEGFLVVKNWLYDWVWTYQHAKDLEKENIFLKNKAAQLREVSIENKELRKLVHLVKSPVHQMVTARVLAYPGRPYVKSILIDAGSENNIKIRSPVVQGRGEIVGRTLEVGPHTTRVLLLNDLNSKVPVWIQGAKEHAILAGDNSPYPILKYVSGNSKIKVGDRVETSGKGGIFFAGMPIGYVMKVTPLMIKIKPYITLDNLKYVCVLNSSLAPNKSVLS